MFTIKFNDSGMTMNISEADSIELFPNVDEWLDIVFGVHNDVKLIEA